MGAIRERHRTVDPHVDADAGGRVGKLLHWFFQPKGNEIAAGRIFAQRYRGGFRRELPAPLDFNASQSGDGEVPVDRVH